MAEPAGGNRASVAAELLNLRKPMEPRRAFFQWSFLWIGGAFALGWVWSVGGLLFESEKQVVYPRPYYEPWTTPGTGQACGLDFCQLYFPAKALRHGENPYAPKSEEFKDPEGRRPGYSPFALLLYLPASFLPFKGALAFHLMVQVLLFIWISMRFLRRAGLGAEVGRFLILIGLLLFGSPIGLSFLERGQNDLYVASAYMLGLGTLLFSGGGRMGAIVAGCLAGIKWTALPLLGAIGGSSLFLQRRYLGFLIAAGFLLTLLAVPSFTGDFIRAMQFWEAADPDGISSDRIWALFEGPKGTSKILYLLLWVGVTLKLAFCRKQLLEREALLPCLLLYLLALAVFSLGIGSIVFEYRMLSQLGLLGAVLYWSSLVPTALRSRFEPWLLYSFALFLIVGFRVFPWHFIRPGYLALVHLGFAAWFFALAAQFQRRILSAPPLNLQSPANLPQALPL